MNNNTVAVTITLIVVIIITEITFMQNTSATSGVDFNHKQFWRYDLARVMVQKTQKLRGLQSTSTYDRHGICGDDRAHFKCIRSRPRIDLV